MFKFVRSLMPREEKFISYFAAHAQLMVASAMALTDMMKASPAERPAAVKKVCELEGQADAVAHETIIALHRAFITPFDRSDIHALTTALDDAVDFIEEVAQHAELYRVETFDAHMLAFAQMIEDCSRLLAEVIPLLKDVNRNAPRINELCRKIGAIESDGDRLLRTALSELIANKPDPILFFGTKEVYELLETVTDRCDDVADLIEGILLDQV